MRLVVIGLGLIGGSAARDLKSRGFAQRVIGVEENPSHAQVARDLGLVDEVLPLAAAIQDADLILLTIPVGAILRLLPQVLDLVGPQSTVTDLGSTKGEICRAVAHHPKRSQYVASHPMAGTENSGPTAALASLFDGKTAVVCDRTQSGANHLSRVEAMYQALKMRVISMAADEHDLHTAFISHLSHISSFVLANTVLAQEKNTATIFDLAGGGFESTVRLAKSSPEMWAPIFEQNRQNIIAAVHAYQAQLAIFEQSLVGGKTETTKELMQNASRIRPVLATIGSRTGSSK